MIRKNFMIILILLNFSLFFIQCETINENRITFEEFCKMDYKNKILIYIKKFKTHPKFGQIDMERWDNQIANEGIKIVPMLKKIVSESFFRRANFEDLTLTNISSIIDKLRENNSIKNEDIKWFANEYKEKILIYLKKHKELDIIVLFADGIVRRLEANQCVYNTYKEVARDIYIKYSELGVKKIRIKNEKYLFDDYKELYKKYNSSSTTRAISGAGGSS